MKTSLICLLLLAAVACAAPQAEEMPGAKRAVMAEKMREKMVEKRKEIDEKMRERTKEKREEMDGKKREEMGGEKRKEMARKMWEKTAEKRGEVAEGKRKESENAVAAAKSDGEAESRYNYCFGPCYSSYGEVIGCWSDFCYYGYDAVFYDYYSNCFCCLDYGAPYSCYYEY